MKAKTQKHILVFLDWSVLVAAYVLALKLNATAHFDVLSASFPFVHPEILFFVVYSGIILLIFAMNQLYKNNVYLGVLRQLQYLAQSLCYSVVGIALLSFFTKSKIIVDSRLILFLFFACSFTMLAVSRVGIFRSLLKMFAAFDINPRPLLILGAGPLAIRLGTMLADRNQYHLHLVGFLDDKIPIGSDVIPDVPVLGRTKNVTKIVKRFLVREILFCTEGLTDEAFLDLLELCAKTRARVMVGSYQFAIIPRRLNLESYGNVPVFGLMNGAPTPAEPFWKKILDPLAALFLIIFLSPLLLLTALAIKLDSRGPVFFKQTRVGKNGRPFTFYKFRSMVTGSEDDGNRKAQLREFISETNSRASGSTKIVNETRVTRIGHFIRKASIDELPQLLNVLKGDMRLVGPRPCLPYEWESYEVWHKRRLSVMPGCTGVWQVLGRSEVGFRDMVILDLFYAYNVSFHLDVWVMLKTIPVMLFGTGGK
jgi:exopolysaccharide biosynthesis polyprenyl glycosylphosphotransferase